MHRFGHHALAALVTLCLGPIAAAQVCRPAQGAQRPAAPPPTSARPSPTTGQTSTGSGQTGTSTGACPTPSSTVQTGTGDCPAPAMSPPPDSGSPVTPDPNGPATAFVDELALVRTGGVGTFTPEYLQSWSLWWDLNQLAFVDVRGRSAARSVRTGSADFFLGEGEHASDNHDGRRIESWVAETLGPAMVHVLRSEENPVLLAETLVAAGRVFPSLSERDRIEVESAILRSLASPSRDVVRSACLAAGISGSHRLAPTLAAVVEDSTAGRRATGGGQVSSDVRAMAAYGLGFLGMTTAREDVRRFAVHTLDHVLDEDAGGRPDLHVAAVLAMASVPLANVGARDAGDRPEPTSSSRAAVLRRLMSLLDSDLDGSVELYLPAAMARLVDDLASDARDGARLEVARALVESLGRSRSRRAEYPAAVAQALGFIGAPTLDACDVLVVKTLEELARDPKAGTEFQALASLGRIAGREGDPAIVERLGDLVVRRIERDSGSKRAWASFALGLAGEGMRSRGARVPDSWSDSIGHALGSARQPEQFAASSVACAMCGSRTFGARVVDGFDDMPSDEARVPTAIALGLLAAHDAVDEIEKWRGGATSDGEAAFGSIVALQLLGNGARIGTSYRERCVGTTSSEAMAASRALGETRVDGGDDALVSWFTDSSRPIVTRASAVRALGRYGELRRSPIQSGLAEVVNIEGAPNTLFDGAGGGVLEVLR